MELRNEPNVRQELSLAKIVIVSTILAGIIGIILFVISNLAPSEKTFATGVTRYAVANGNWNSTSTWASTSGGSSGASIPVAGDIVYIGEGGSDRAVTIPSGYTANCATLYIGSNSYDKTNSLTLSSSTSVLNVSGDLTIRRPSGSHTNALNVSSGTVTVGNDCTLAGTSTSSGKVAKIDINSGSLIVSGDLVAVAGSTSNNKIDMGGGSGTLYIGGAFDPTYCDFTKGTGTVVYNGQIAQTIKFFPNDAYYNLTIENTHSSGATLSADITTSKLSGNLTIGSASSSSLLSTADYDITFNNSKSLTLLENSTLDAGSSVISFGTGCIANVNGTFRTTNSYGFSGSTSTAIKSTNSPTIILGSNSNIEYTATGSQTITARSYKNLSIIGGSKTISSGTLTIENDLVIESGATYDGSTNDPTLIIGGDFINNGTFNQGSHSVTLNGTQSQTIGGSSPTTFDDLIIINTYSVAPQITLEKSMTITGTLTLTTGIISIGSNDIVMASGSSLSGGSILSFVYTGGTGVFKWMSCAANTNRLFPVGLNSTSSGYSPLTLTFNNGHTTDHYSVLVDSAITTNGSKTGTPIKSNVIKGTWHISESVSGGSNLNMKFAWGSSRIGSNLNMNKDCQLLHYGSSGWERPSGKRARITNGSLPYITFSGYTGTFSPFGIEGNDGSVQLYFTGTPTVSGTPGNVGTKYTWNNVGTTSDSTTIKAVIEIISITGGASLENIDQSQFGSNAAWQPIVNGSQTNGNCWGMEFRVRFYNATTNARLTLSSFKAQGIDIDGDADKIREYNTFDNPASYSVESNTYLTITSSPPHIMFKGPTTNVPDIGLTETQYIASCNYTNTDSVTITLGGCCDGGSCATFSGNRLHSINFYDAVNYTNPLPVEMIYFNTEIKGETALLSWATASEINNSHFEVQRSSDGKNWTKIGRVEGNGNSNRVINYDFTDDEPLATNFYRLKQMDYDGKFEYSKTKVVDFASGKITIRAYPNPTRGEMTLDITRTSVADGIHIEIMDIAGSIVKEMNFDPDGNQNLVTPVDISFCKNGLYIIRVTCGQTIQSYKITKF